MKELPILFSAPMVRAILAGTKTQTRRIIKLHIRCQYGAVGDRLWVRENGWERPYRSDRMLAEGADTWPAYAYDADCTEPGELEQLKEWGWRRRPAIHMPRWASRITLEIRTVRAQLLRDISEEDAKAEGVESVSVADVPRNAAWSAKQDFAQLWNKINGKRPGCSWADNPWIWAVSFRVVTDR